MLIYIDFICAFDTDGKLPIETGIGRLFV